jgi:hypothetical protein
VGKTRSAAGTGLWFLYNHKPAVVITTAPTGRQNRYLLWGEIRKLHRLADQTLKEKRNIPLGMGDELYETMYLKEEHDTWYAIGFSTDDSDAFTGFHEVNILFIVDEASGVKAEIFEGIEGSLNSPNSRVLSIGNPTDPTSYFGSMFLTSEGRNVNKIHINCEQSPNVLAGKNVIPGLCNWDWPQKMREKWGEHDPRYQIRVQGNFIKEGTNSLVSFANAQRALVPSEKLKLYIERPLILSIDVAYEGDDLCIFLLREKSVLDTRRLMTVEDGEVVYDPDDWSDVEEQFGDHSTFNPYIPAEEGEEIGAKVIKTMAKSKFKEIVNAAMGIVKENPNIVDIAVDFVGSDVSERLQEMKEEEGNELLKNINIWGVNVGEGSNFPQQFKNLRAELAHYVKKDIEDGILLIDDDDLSVQLFQLTYKYDGSTKFVLMPKPKFKQLHRISPDKFDALMLSYGPRALRERQGEPEVRWL